MKSRRRVNSTVRQLTDRKGYGMEYDALTGSDEDYSAFVEWLESETASSLEQAKGDEPAIATAIRTYLETGYSAHLTSGELVDFFCVNTPSILDKAGYFEVHADWAVELYDQIDPEVFKKFRS
jgi:hypothetical protein